jgi:hypothetical protein
MDKAKLNSSWNKVSENLSPANSSDSIVTERYIEELKVAGSNPEISKIAKMGIFFILYG